MNKKGQSALEFIMTYGWALVVLLLVISSLWFTFGGDKFFVNEKCMMGPGFLCKDFSVDEGSIQLKVLNSQGKNIDSFSFSSSECNYGSDTTELKNGKEKIFSTTGCTFVEEVFDGVLDLSYKFSGSTIIHSKSASLVSLISTGNSQAFGGGNNGNSGGGYYSDGGTVLLYKFDENYGPILKDESSKGNDGKIYGDTVVVYNFDDGSGNIVSDKSNWGFDGNFSGTTQWSSGISGGGVYLDAEDTTGIFMMNGTSAENYEEDYSYSVWFKSNATSGGDDVARIISRDCSDYFCLYLYQLLNTHQNKTAHHFDNANSFRTSPLSDPFEWHHVVGTWDIDNNEFIYYLDGFEHTKRTNLGTYVSSIRPIVLGGNTEGDGNINGNNFLGYIDEVSFYDKTLKPSEVSELFNSKTAKFFELETGKYGTALELDGEDDYVQIVGMDINVTNKFTWEAWIYPRNVTPDQVFLTDQTSNANYFRILGKKLFASFNIRDLGQTTLSGYTSLQNNQWYHVVAQYDGSSIKIYLDGVLDAEKTGLSGDVIINNGDLFNVGIWITSDQRHFNGLIDEVRISDYARYE